MGFVCTNRDQLLNFFERKSQALHSLHKSQALNVAGRIKAKPARAAECRRQQLATLIKPDGVDAESSALCEFANLKCRLHAVPNARHETSIQSGVQSRVKHSESR